MIELFVTQIKKNVKRSSISGVSTSLKPFHSQLSTGVAWFEYKLKIKKNDG